MKEQIRKLRVHCYVNTKVGSWQPEYYMERGDVVIVLGDEIIEHKMLYRGLTSTPSKDLSSPKTGRVLFLLTKYGLRFLMLWWSDGTSFFLEDFEACSAEETE